jgi:tetratricopeptide (TPR) repeat protein
MGRWLRGMLLAMIISFAASGPAAAQVDDLGAFDQQFRALYSQGKYAEAATFGERLIKITEQAHGSNTPATAAALNNLAMMYQALGRYEEAFKACDWALAIHEPALGPEQRVSRHRVDVVALKLDAA